MGLRDSERAREEKIIHTIALLKKNKEEKRNGKDHRKRAPSASFLERQRGTAAEAAWSGDGRSSAEKVSGGCAAARRRRPGLGRTSGLRQTASPDGMPTLDWRRRHGVFRIGEGDGRHGGSGSAVEGELLSSSPLLPRSGDRPRLLTARQERLGGGDEGGSAGCFLRRRRMIPASQERFLLRSLALSSSDLWWLWWWLPKSVESTENLPARRLSYPMSPSSSGALGPTCGVRKKSRLGWWLRSAAPEESDFLRDTYGDTDLGNAGAACAARG